MDDEVEPDEVERTKTGAPVAAPDPEPEPRAPSDESRDDDLRAALLGLDRPDAGSRDAEPATEPEPEPEPDREPERSAKSRRQRRRAPDAGRPDEPAGVVPPMPVGGLSDAEFNSALSDWRGVRSCLATEQVRGTATRNGAIRVAFTIADDGSVTEARVVEASNAFARALGPCVERAALRVEFPSFEGPPSVEKVAKFVF